MGGFGGYLAKTVKRPTATAGEGRRGERLASSHARVFTATDAGVLDDAVVLVEDGASPPWAAAWCRPRGKVGRRHGQDAAAGLIDAHVHLINTAAPTWYLALPDAKHNLEAYLYAGVTSGVDGRRPEAGDRPSNRDWARWVPGHA